jgi:tetratricopeptide (TPR) repeat protein
MLTLTTEEKKKWIATLPFPLANFYQELLSQQAVVQKNTVGKEDNNLAQTLWTMSQCFHLLGQTVAIWTICDYLATAKEKENEKREVHRAFLDGIADGEPNWSLLTQRLIVHLAEQQQFFPNQIPELLELTSSIIYLPQPPSAALPFSISSRKPYSWFGLMQLWHDLEHHLFAGDYRFTLPTSEVLSFYTNLLETAFNSCVFFERYVTYVLVSRDERKTRGFVCQGPQSQPVGITGIGSGLWHSLKGKAFLCSTGPKKKYLSLFPLVVPLLQKHGERTAFHDLLFYQSGGQDKMCFYGYRSRQYCYHQQCAPGAFGVWQKDLRWLETHATKSQELNRYIISFEALTAYRCRSFVGRNQVFKVIAETIQTRPAGYFYLRAHPGYGQTAVFSMLYQCARQGNFSQAAITWQGATPIFAWHFCGELARCDDPIMIFKSLYGQILQKVYGYSESTIVASLQKLPGAPENLQRSLENLLTQISKEVLTPRQQKLVVVIDGLDESHLSMAALATLVSFMPVQLPAQIIFLFSCSNHHGSSHDFTRQQSSSYVPLFCMRLPGKTASELPAVSPLSPLSQEEVAEWEALYLKPPEEQKEAVNDWLWEKSQGDPFYLTLLLDSIAAGQILWRNPALLPCGRYALLDQLWQNIPEVQPGQGYRLLGLLAEIRQLANDEMIGMISGYSPETTQRQRWYLNHLLRYEDSVYTLSHTLSNSFIRAQFTPQENKNFHSDIAKYYRYTAEEEKILYRRLSEEGLRNLSYHYYHADAWIDLYTLVMDNDFKEEKLKRFKVYHEYLTDITFALQAGVERRQYEEVLHLGYRYSAVMSEALQGVAHAFRIAAQKDYEQSLERLRAIRDEQDFFRAVLIVLWYALYNEDRDKIPLILEELDRIPDDQVSFCMRGQEPLVIFLLTKLRQSDAGRIDSLIGKHGLKGKEAIEYLLKLQNQLDFQKEQFKHFAYKVLKSAAHLLSAKDKKESLDKLIGLGIKAEQFAKSPEIWQQLLAFCEGIGELTLQLDALKNLGSTMLPLNEGEYKEAFAQIVAKLAVGVASEANKAVHFVQYAGLLRLVGKLEEAQKFIEESFRYVEQERQENLADFLQTILDELEEGRELLPQEWSDKIFFLLRKISDESHKLGLVEVAVVSLVYRGEIAKAFKLLEQGSLNNVARRFATLKKIIRYLKTVHGTQFSQTISHWSMVLEQITSLNQRDYCRELLEDVASSLMQIKVPENDPIWNRYVAVVEKLKDLDSKELTQQLLARLASGLAEKGFLDKCREVIFLISDPKWSSAPLADFAIHWIRKNAELSVALDVLKDVLYIKDQLKVLGFIVTHIPAGDQGRALWKRITTTLQTMNWQQEQREGWDSYLLQIVNKLSEDLPLDESAPLWQDVFDMLEMLPYENLGIGTNPAYTANLRELGRHNPTLNTKLKLLEAIITNLSRSKAFEKTASLWPMIDEVVAQIEFPYGKARLQAAVAITLAQFGQIWEANEALDKAYATLQNENNPVLVLDSLAKIAAGYRELGKESRCRELFEQLLRYSGITEGKKIKYWDAHEFMLYLSSIGLEDFALLLAEKMVLAVVDIGEESPPPETLSAMILLCLQSGYYAQARELFFRLLPGVSKENSSVGETPLYVQVTQMLEKIPDEKIFREIWESTAELVLNFPRVAMQEQCLENLAFTLRQRNHYEDYKAMWDKLFSQAGYIGSQFESLRSAIRISKHLAYVAPLDVVEEQFRCMWEKIPQISSEYDQIHLLETIAEMLVAFPHFAKVNTLWNLLANFAKKCKRQDCQGLALMSLGKTLARRARETKEWQMLPEIAKLIENIGKPQQKCEGYLAIAREYYAGQNREATLAAVHKMLEVGKNLHSKLLPSVIELLLGFSEYELALQTIQEIQEALPRVTLWCEVIRCYCEQGKEKEARNLLERTLPQIKNVEPQYGEQARLYTMAASYALRLKGVNDAVLLFDKALTNWEAIINASYQKEAVSLLATILQNMGDAAPLLVCWQKLLAKAQKIEHDIYRLRAIQDVAQGLARIHQFSLLCETMSDLPIASDTRLQVLATYVEEADPRDTLSFLKMVCIPDERNLLIKRMAVSFARKENLDGLFRLWLEVPGNFALLCDLTTKILGLVLKSQGKEAFARWFAQIAPAWGVVAKK